MTSIKSMPDVARRLIGELTPLMQPHGLTGAWHPDAATLRLDGGAEAAPVAISMTPAFVTKFDAANSELQRAALQNIVAQVEMKYSPTAKAEYALKITPDLRSLDGQ